MARCGPGGGRRRATAEHAACRGGLDCKFGAGRGEERTLNICPMFVTLEVSCRMGHFRTTLRPTTLGTRAQTTPI